MKLEKAKMFLGGHMLLPAHDPETQWDKIMLQNSWIRIEGEAWRWSSEPLL